MSNDKPRVDKTVAMPMVGGSVERTLHSIPTAGARQLADAAALKAAGPRVVIANEAIRDIVPLTKAEFVFGRNPGAGADFVIDHPAISGAHCKVYCREDRFYVQDLGSKNHTFVDGEMLQPGSPKEIRPEGSLRIGAVETLFVANVDAQGRRLDPKKIRSALDLLETEGRITGLQRDRAEREASGSGSHAGEKLLVNGDLKVDDWIRAYERGDTFHLIQKEASKKAARLGLIVVIQFVVIAVLAVLLVLKSGLI
ncbi:MAG: FHA domain-containing protein [Myxococcota bacterium]